MKTKLIANIAAAFCLTLLASCQEVHKVKVAVVEEDGKTPVAGAEVAVYYLGYDTSKDKEVAGTTDEKGVFVAKGRAPLRMEARIAKKGYYKTFSGRLSRKKDHDLTFVLRRIKNPVAMYAKRLQIGSPVVGKEFGYDMMAGDWVAPYGSGKIADLIFKTNIIRKKDRYVDFHYELDLRFPNPKDGFLFVFQRKNSEFKSPYEAPADGDYQKTWTQIEKRTPGSGIVTNDDPNRCYIFRVRTKTDGKGNIISCHYAKGYGEISDIRLYFNPIPNDRNLEFDPQKNLFKDLRAEEWPHDP